MRFLTRIELVSEAIKGESDLNKGFLFMKIEIE